eukprot:CAMPEP_0205821380 /NCGR_PEP_ID=MMETSP0206-20130828/7453_1 /ASSEMBLY_ACC=CAM_ASM_000279 /TAXON_ID=36767 /ORGANISM="Euplotes focardii, Strain TN1" /LENGTH=184 /DNA_ID=CAMNT_0053116825 /DNA_START=60 /DNA_END=614 /DNA_ORIENTATION=-
MVSLKMQKRLAASVLDCGKRKVWIDPNETDDVAMANSRNDIRRMIKDGLVLKKPPTVHSRSRTRRRLEAKRLGRHTGPGKRRGTADARMPAKVLWVRRQRVLRRLLKKYREQNKIDRHTYHEFYLKSKGNVYKNKRVLIEAIHKQKNERSRQIALDEQAEARRAKNKIVRQKRAVNAAKADRKR